MCARRGRVGGGEGRGEGGSAAPSPDESIAALSGQRRVPDVRRAQGRDACDDNESPPATKAQRKLPRAATPKNSH